METGTLKIYLKAESLFKTLMKDKRLLLMLAIIIGNVSLGFSQDDTGMTTTLWQKATTLYQIMSVFVLLACIFFCGKSAMEGMRGEQGAWLKFGAILAIGLVWFFALPPFIKYLRTQSSGQTNFGS